MKNGEIKSIEDSNRIIQKLLAKLNINNSGENSKQNNLSEEIKLEMKKIKEMYLSYDSAALTSNIVNIDLSELIDCLAL